MELLEIIHKPAAKRIEGFITLVMSSVRTAVRATAYCPRRAADWPMIVAPAHIPTVTKLRRVVVMRMVYPAEHIDVRRGHKIGIGINERLIVISSVSSAHITAGA